MIFDNANIFDGERFHKGSFAFNICFEDQDDEKLDLDGLWVLPGLVDTHAHLRDPGQTRREDLISGTRSAAHGGITTVFAMSNTTPAIDNEAMVLYIKEKSQHAKVNVKIVGALTKGREGKELTEMHRMARAGVVGFSDDGNFLNDASLARHAMEYAHEIDLPIISHCQDRDLGVGHMREGWYSTLYGIYAMPDVAESIAVSREIELSYLTKAHVHIAHVSTARSVKLIRQAKKDGINITCDVCIHHLIFTDEDLHDYDTSKKINPPFPTAEDQIALYEGLEDETIDAIITDHAPYTAEEKEVEFQLAPFGIIGFETLLNEILMVSQKGIKVELLLKKVTSDPAKLYKLNEGRIQKGLPANFVIFDPDQKWIVSRNTIQSKSTNTPFLNRTMNGKVIATYVNGRQVYGNVENFGKGILRLA
ncbi:MAG: dihydroorotase [Thermotogae bacterium]|jgi:dihydroorotase|nr:dihydroorotase [Thermotogota bacterium]MCL5033209.1 dihydroorotase [Thermotogota bacterium]